LSIVRSGRSGGLIKKSAGRFPPDAKLPPEKKCEVKILEEKRLRPGLEGSNCLGLFEGLLMRRQDKSILGMKQLENVFIYAYQKGWMVWNFCNCLILSIIKFFQVFELIYNK